MQPRRSPGRVDQAVATLALLLVPLCVFLMGCQNANLLTPQQKATISQGIQNGLVKAVTGLGVLSGLTGLDQPIYIYSPEMPGSAPFQAPGATVHLEGSFSGMGRGVQPSIEIVRKHQGHESTSTVSVTSQGQWSADVDLAQGLNVFVARAVLGDQKGPDSNEVAVQADNAPPAGGVAQTAPAPGPASPQQAPAASLADFRDPLDGKGKPRDNFGADGTSGYIDGKWHFGEDIMVPEGTEVYPVASGDIVSYSPNGWSSPGKADNYGVLIRHRTADGRHFIALYGHLLRPKNPDGSIMGEDEIRRLPLRHVGAAESLGVIGQWNWGNHLHLGIYRNPGNESAMPEHPYGLADGTTPPGVEQDGVNSYNNWLDPLDFLKLHKPAL